MSSPLVFVYVALLCLFGCYVVTIDIINLYSSTYILRVLLVAKIILMGFQLYMVYSNWLFIGIFLGIFLGFNRIFCYYINQYIYISMYIYINVYLYKCISIYINEKVQSIFWGLLAHDLLFISFYRSLLAWQGATISNNPNFYGTSPTFLTGLYLNILANPNKSSSGVIFLLSVSIWIRSVSTSTNYFLSKSGGSTISTKSSIIFCLIISSIIKDLSREGDELISIRWHCPSVSIITS